MATPASNQFSAADSALGYLYQVRLGLLWALKRLKNGTEFVVSLETLDDVTFETGGTPNELLQTKHHLTREATLTDASPDLWKSLRVWFEGTANKTIPSETQFYLITTSSAEVNSAASKLLHCNRDVKKALATFEVTAQTSTNQANAAAYRSFLDTPANERCAILDRVVILDRSPTINNLDNDLKSELFWATERQYQDAFLQYLEGWWLRRVINQLTQINAGDKIPGTELEAKMSDLREQFKQNALPIADDLLNFNPDSQAIAEYGNFLFVSQLNLAKAGKRRIVAAIRDYYRAFNQRSQWIRHDLLMVGDLGVYEKRLKEEWDLIFAAKQDEVDNTATEQNKEIAAREVLGWAEQACIPIRPAVTEPFITRGSLHMLADKLQIGWHIDFKERLETLLLNREASV